MKQFSSITLRHFVTHTTGIAPVKENTSKSDKKQLEIHLLLAEGLFSLNSSQSARA